MLQSTFYSDFLAMNANFGHLMVLDWNLFCGRWQRFRQRCKSSAPRRESGVLSVFIAILNTFNTFSSWTNDI